MKTKLIAKCLTNAGNALGKKFNLNIVDRKALEKAHNLREAEIAKAYFNESPTIGNLLKGAYHWASSKPWLLGESETGAIGGTAPAVGLRPGANVVKYIKNMTLPGLFGENIYIGTSKGLKAAKAADSAAKGAKQTKKVKPVRQVTEVYNIKTGDPYDGPLPEDWETMLPRENWAIRTITK